MSGDAVKAYVYLLAEAWLQDDRATLPDDDEELASLARISMEKWHEIKHEVMQVFSSSDSGEHAGRIVNERQYEIHRISIAKQRLNNKNAKRTQMKRKVNARPEIETDTEIDTDLVKNTKKKITKKDTFTPPEFNEFKAYCKENGFENISERAFKYYSEMDWCDSTGKPIKSWKGKLQAVWFRDDNKRGPGPTMMGLLS